MAGQLDGEILRDGGLGQVLERQLPAQTVRLQLALDRLQRMLAEDHIDRPVGAERR